MITKTTFDFLKSLAKNNNRKWFKEHQRDYRDARWEFMAFVQDIAHEIGKFDPSIAKILGEKKTIKYFRIHRDVRFSKNKDPYKLNFGGAIGKGGMDMTHPGYYIHIEPGNSFLAGGLYMPDPKVLAKIRKAIDKDAKPLRKILATKSYKDIFGGLSNSDDLKTAPKGYPKDHKDIDLLRHRHFIAYREYKDKEVLSKDFTKQTIKAFKALEPLNTYLRLVA